MKQNGFALARTPLLKGNLLQSFDCEVVDSELIDDKLFDSEPRKPCWHKKECLREALRGLSDFGTLENLEILDKHGHTLRNSTVGWTNTGTQSCDLFYCLSIFFSTQPSHIPPFISFFLLSNTGLTSISYEVIYFHCTAYTTVRVPIFLRYL